MVEKYPEALPANQSEPRFCSVGTPLPQTSAATANGPPHGVRWKNDARVDARRFWTEPGTSCNTRSWFKKRAQLQHEEQ